ncbi:solute carrier family 23 protein [Mycolicibacterium mucogenicum]|uniref:Xanthine permease n=1 Tax=Mycolicibacterium mucogenicum TaxID=56689 RepID=A0A4R5WEW1_MYCMU|nr:solute carrier family 23 protein [Mycolicibacterium mucogenicum]TDK88536.1 xanthine permease [Mycolicibacterium mucogenicum]
MPIDTNRAAVARKAVHPVDEVLPIPKLAVYGTQHVLAFYAGAVLVPIIVAGALKLSPEQMIHLINADLFTCGIATIIQSVGFWKVGVKLPLIQGVTFAAVSPMIAIGTAGGLSGVPGLLSVYGSVIVAGLFTFFMAPYFSKLLRFFPPVVTGSVITIIGIALLPVAANDIVGGTTTEAMKSDVALKDLAYAAGTLLIIVVMQRLFRGFLATIAVLAGLVIGTAVAALLGDVDFSAVGTSHWLGVTTPFYFGWPTFSATAIISMIVVMIITAVETTGDVFATAEIVGKRVGANDIARALRADGMATTIGGVLNSFPYTCFAENVGLVRLTQVKSRWVVATAGVIMIVLGYLPKAAAVVAAIPHSVLGGASLALFATVAVVGIQTLSKVDFNDHRNAVIVGTALGLGMLATAQPLLKFSFPAWAQIICGSGITLGALAAIVLNIVFFHIGPNRGPMVAGTPRTGEVGLDAVNKMTQEEFVKTFSVLYQGLAWPVERAFAQRPFADTRALRGAVQTALLAATPAEQMELMQAYPGLSETQEHHMSKVDLAYLGLDGLTEEEAEEFSELSAAYEAKFGFPLIICLRDLESREHILTLGWRRLDNSPQVEHMAALSEISRIAAWRFDDLVADANPIASARRLRIAR